MSSTPTLPRWRRRLAQALSVTAAASMITLGAVTPASAAATDIVSTPGSARIAPVSPDGWLLMAQNWPTAFQVKVGVKNTGTTAQAIRRFDVTAPVGVTFGTSNTDTTMSSQVTISGVKFTCTHAAGLRSTACVGASAINLVAGATLAVPIPFVKVAPGTDQTKDLTGGTIAFRDTTDLTGVPFGATTWSVTPNWGVRIAQPAVPTVLQGQTGTTTFQAINTDPNTSGFMLNGVVFTAPTNTTFGEADFYWDGDSQVKTGGMGCTISTDKKTLTCKWPGANNTILLTPALASNPTMGVKLIVDPSVAPGTVLTGGTFASTDYVTNPVKTNFSGTFAVRTPAALSAGSLSGVQGPSPVFTGTAEPGAKVELVVDGTTVGTATAGPDGKYSLTPSPALTTGDHTVGIIQRDQSGNASTPVTQTITVDATAPDAPAVTPITGPIPASKTFTGTGEPGATVDVQVDGKSVGTATVGADGTWSLTPAAPLPGGDHTLTITQKDKVGNVSTPTTQQITVDDTAPAAPAVTPITGPIPATPNFTGTGEPGATVDVTVDGKSIGTAKVGADGTWSLSPKTPLAEGDHTLTVTQTDAAGNVSQPTTQKVTVDATAPTAPAVTPIDGPIPASPTFTGTGEPGATVDVTVDGKSVGTATVGTDGKWSLTPAAPLPAGGHELTVTQKDAAGNVSKPTTQQVTVDDTAPTAPAVAPITGPIPASPTFTGTGEPGATVDVTVDGKPVGTATVGADGTWSLTPKTPLTEGDHALSITQTDAAGNTSAPTTQQVTVDDTAPTAPSVTPIEGVIPASPTFTGTGEPGATVTVQVDGKPVGTATVGADGTWSVTPTSPLPAGDHQLSVSQKDHAGNQSAPVTQKVTVTGPAVSLTDLRVTAGDTVQVGLVGFTPNSTATLVLHSTPQTLATVKVDANGRATVTVRIPAGTTPGAHSIIVTDTAGLTARTALTVLTDTTGTALAATGGTILWTSIGIGALTLLTGALLLTRRRRRDTEIEQETTTH